MEFGSTYMDTEATYIVSNISSRCSYKVGSQKKVTDTCSIDMKTIKQVKRKKGRNTDCTEKPRK